MESIISKEEEIFNKFCSIRAVKAIDKSIIEEFLYYGLWHRRPIIKKTQLSGIIELFNEYDLDFQHIKNEYIRLCCINNELDRFLNNPIICCKPLIIDLGRYKKYTSKKPSIINEQGYYQIMEIFSGYCVVLKRLNSGRFIRVNLDKNLINLIKIGDIINLMASQNIFLGWSLINVYGYYPIEAEKYIKQKG